MSSDKVVAAREWGDAIHVVRVEWLLACVREWRRVSEKEFEVQDVNEDDVETGDDELEGNVELEGNAEMGNAEMENAEMENAETGNEDDVETGSDEKDEDQVVWEKLFDGGNLPQK